SAAEADDEVDQHRRREVALEGDGDEREEDERAERGEELLRARHDAEIVARDDCDFTQKASSSAEAAATAPAKENAIAALPSCHSEPKMAPAGIAATPTSR